jgi:hypothetical protein
MPSQEDWWWPFFWVRLAAWVAVELILKFIHPKL